MPLFGLRPHARRAQRLLHCNVDRMKLVVPRELLRHRAAAEIFKHDEIAKEVEKASLVKNSLDHHLEFGYIIFSKRLTGDRSPRFEPLPTRAASDPMRA